MCVQVRFTARSFGVPGDHPGQMSTGMRWPFGPVGLITPFNFPLEIPALQVIGALMMGNKPLVHVDHRSVTIGTRSCAGMVSILRVSDVNSQDKAGRHRTDINPA